MHAIKYCQTCQIETARSSRGQCKPCTKRRSAEWRIKNRERSTATIKAWRESNKARCKEVTAKYHKTHSAKIKELKAAYETANSARLKMWRKEWLAANHDKVKAVNTAWRRANPDKMKRIIARSHAAVDPVKRRAREAAWRAANPEASAARCRNRTARKKHATGTHTSADIKLLFTTQNGKCVYCKVSIEDGYHVDHIMPLARGGSNDKSNIQLLCPTCNRRKSAKHPLDFARSMGLAANETETPSRG